MEQGGNEKIKVKTKVHISAKKAWEFWTKPEHIKKWYFGSDDWHTPFAENNLSPGGKFLFRMEAKDGSAGFDFTGSYDIIEPHKHIAYTLVDGRKVDIKFVEKNDITEITEVFDMENELSKEAQQQGWQSLLNHFKAYVEEKI